MVKQAEDGEVLQTWCIRSRVESLLRRRGCRRVEDLFDQGSRVLDFLPSGICRRELFLKVTMKKSRQFKELIDKHFRNNNYFRGCSAQVDAEESDFILLSWYRGSEEIDVEEVSRAIPLRSRWMSASSDITSSGSILDGWLQNVKQMSKHFQDNTISSWTISLTQHLDRFRFRLY